MFDILSYFTEDTVIYVAQGIVMYIFDETHTDEFLHSALDDYRKAYISDEDLESIKTLTVEVLNSDDWIEKIVSLTSLVIEMKDEAETMTLLAFWMSGLRYVEIADKMNMPIDDVVGRIEWLRGDFLQASKSILRYLCTRFDIQNEALNDWPIMVEKGICSKNQLMMLRKGLSDRDSFTRYR